jgi:hypothetical protein
VAVGSVTRLVLCKNRPNCTSTEFLLKLMHKSFTVEQSRPKIRAVSVIFEKLTQVISCPMSENSPNLVSLVVGLEVTLLLKSDTYILK